MRWPDTLRGRVSIALLASGVLLLGAACQSQPADPADPASEELSVEELLSSVAAELDAMTTAQFGMIDELESGAEFFGTTFKSMDAEVSSPDRVHMRVDVIAPGLGFAQVEILAVGEQSLIKFSRDAPWIPLPLDQVPFNFGGMGLTLSALLPVLQDPTVVVRESVGDFQTIRVDGNVMSEDMSNLITSVDPGHAITLSYWFDENGHTLRQLRIDGQLFNDDAPETSRLVNMDIDVPVDIQLPEVASGS